MSQNVEINEGSPVSPVTEAKENAPAAPAAEKKPARRSSRKAAAKEDAPAEASSAAPVKKRAAPKKRAAAEAPAEEKKPARRASSRAKAGSGGEGSDAVLPAEASAAEPAAPHVSGGKRADAPKKRAPRKAPAKKAEAGAVQEPAAAEPAAQATAEAPSEPAAAVPGRPAGRRKTARKEPAADDDAGNRAEPAPQQVPGDAQPEWQDEGIVTSILSFPAAKPQDVRSIRRTRRNRQGGDGKAFGNASPYAPAPYRQDAFHDPDASFEASAYPKRRLRDKKLRRGGRSAIGFHQEDSEYTAAMLSDSILGVTQVQKQDADFMQEDDGPQPALPGQPMAIPQFSDDLQEEDLEALDAAVNGNRIGAPVQQAAKEARQSRRTRKSPRELRTEQKNAADVKKVRRVLYIGVVPGEQTEVAITEDGQVTEYFVELAHQVKIRGNIYKGVINNIDTNLQAAFVNFGNGKNGFLQIDEVHPEYYLIPHEETPGAKYPPIQKALKVGQEVLVQVVKEPAGSKGAFLTTWLSIAGRFLVLTPGQEQIGVSRKVTDQAERARLKELIAGIQPGENMGVIIRTASEGASTDSIQQDLQFLKKLYAEILEKAGEEKSPSLIYQEADLASRAVRDYLSESITEIWTDDEATQKRLEETVGILFPGKEIVKLHKDPRHGMWERFGLLKQLESVTSREVLLPSGGRLVFDQTEALMAIDINSGKTQGKSSFEAMVFRTNMEAAEAIARHLRLRDIGGQVVIDFIEMREKSHCAEVERTLRNAMRRDKASHDIGHMSSFGLLELVRQRTGTSAISISTEPCPHCHGTGLRRNMEWQSLHALRDIEIKMGKLKDGGGKGKKNEQRQDHAPFCYECDAELALYVLNHKRDRLFVLEEKFGTRIEIKIK